MEAIVTIPGTDCHLDWTSVCDGGLLALVAVIP